MPPHVRSSLPFVRGNKMGGGHDRDPAIGDIPLGGPSQALHGAHAAAHAACGVRVERLRGLAGEEAGPREMRAAALPEALRDGGILLWDDAATAGARGRDMEWSDQERSRAKLHTLSLTFFSPVACCSIFFARVEMAALCPAPQLAGVSARPARRSARIGAVVCRAEARCAWASLDKADSYNSWL